MSAEKGKNEASIALVGEPGVAKSHMVYAQCISPQGVFAHGEGISMVGIK